MFKRPIGFAGLPFALGAVRAPDDGGAGGGGGDSGQDGGQQQGGQDGGQQQGGQDGGQQQGGQQQGGGDFLSGLADDQRKYAMAKGWDKVGMAGVLDQYRNLEQKVGVDTVRLPGADAKPEELDAIFDKLGRPKAAAGDDGYKLAAPEGVAVDETLDGWFREAAFGERLTQAQAEGMYNKWNELQTQAAAAQAAEDEKALSSLKAEKGAEYTAFEEAAKAAVREFCPKDAQGEPDGEILDRMEQMLQMGGLLRVWGEIGQKISNFGARDMSSGGAHGLPGTPQQALSEIKKITEARASDPKHPLNDQRNVGYKDAAAHWAALHKIAYPDRGSA